VLGAVRSEGNDMIPLTETLYHFLSGIYLEKTEASASTVYPNKERFPPHHTHDALIVIFFHTLT
jgi:hypothetical protein